VTKKPSIPDPGEPVHEEAPDRNETASEGPPVEGMKRRTFLSVLAGLPFALGLGALLGRRGTAAPSGADAAAAAKGGLSKKDARLSDIDLPPGLDPEDLTDADVERISDMVAKGTPSPGGGTVGDAVAADHVFPGPCEWVGTFSGGENCQIGYICQDPTGDFVCQGHWYDDFECEQGFICDPGPHDFFCLYSFDASDCELPGHDDFKCGENGEKFFYQGGSGFPPGFGTDMDNPQASGGWSSSVKV